MYSLLTTGHYRIPFTTWTTQRIIDSHYVMRQDGALNRDVLNIENMYVYIESFISMNVFPSHYQTLQVQGPLRHLEHLLDHPAQQVMTLVAAVLMPRCMSLYMLCSCSCQEYIFTYVHAIYAM